MTIVIIDAIFLLMSHQAPQRQVVSNIAHVYGVDPVEGDGASPRVTPLPGNVTIAPELGEVVRAMLDRSATFRAQCNRLALAADLRVTAQRSIQAPLNAAITRLTRRAGGGLDAEVEVNPFGDPIVLIAHEFEHIVEQLDDVNLPALASRHGTGVHCDPASGRFETERATAVGLRVAREVSNFAARR